MYYCYNGRKDKENPSECRKQIWVFLIWMWLFTPAFNINNEKKRKNLPKILIIPPTIHSNSDTPTLPPPEAAPLGDIKIPVPGMNKLNNDSYAESSCCSIDLV